MSLTELPIKAQHIIIEGDQIDIVGPVSGLPTVTLANGGSGSSLVQDGTGPALATKSLSATGNVALTPVSGTNVNIHGIPLNTGNAGGGLSVLYDNTAGPPQTLRFNTLAELETEGVTDPPSGVQVTLSGGLISIGEPMYFGGGGSAECGLHSWVLNPTTYATVGVASQAQQGMWKRAGEKLWLTVSVLQPSGIYWVVPDGNSYAYGMLFDPPSLDGPPLLNYACDEQRPTALLKHSGGPLYHCLVTLMNLPNPDAGNQDCVAMVFRYIQPGDFSGGEKLYFFPDQSTWWRYWPP